MLSVDAISVNPISTLGSFGFVSVLGPYCIHYFLLACIGGEELAIICVGSDVEAPQTLAVPGGAELTLDCH